MLIEPPGTRFDLRWRMLGIPVRVSPWFWITALLLTYYKDITLSILLVGIACIFVSILLHEFGHALTGRAFGAREMRVVLYQLGGLAISRPGRARTWHRLLELSMGPGAGFVLWGVLFAGSYLFDYESLLYSDSYTTRLVWLALQRLMWINLIWGLLNLIPVYPLDGGQIVRELLLSWRPFEGHRRAHTLSMYVAVCAALGFLVHALWSQGTFLTFLPVLFFAYFAYLNHQLRRPEFEYADRGGGRYEAPRQPWEQDPDWWKR